MPSLVLELQREALDPTIRLTDLLRKALVVARKLRISEFESWIMAELGGYATYADIPAYRVIHGEVKAQNPVNGRWMPVMFASAQEAAALSKQKVGPGVAELEDLLGREGGQLLMIFSPEVEARLMRNMNVPAKPTLTVSPSAMRGIVDAVRTIVLNWSLKLEEDGILGEGMSFSPVEREIAAGHTYNIANFYGSVSASQIQQGSDNSSQHRD